MNQRSVQFDITEPKNHNCIDVHRVVRVVHNSEGAVDLSKFQFLPLLRKIMSKNRGVMVEKPLRIIDIMVLSISNNISSLYPSLDCEFSSW